MEPLRRSRASWARHRLIRGLGRRRRADTGGLSRQQPSGAAIGLRVRALCASPAGADLGMGRVVHDRRASPAWSRPGGASSCTRSGFGRSSPGRKLLFEPAAHLISTKELTGIHAVADRYGVPVVPLPRPEHAGEWCRTREIGLASEVVEQTLLRGVRLRLRRTSRVSLDRRWLRVGVWPEVVGSPSCSPEEAVHARARPARGPDLHGASPRTGGDRRVRERGVRSR